MQVLVCNDDGINCKLIKILAAAFKKYGAVLVMAPHNEQSAKSHSIDISEHYFKDIKDYGVIDGIRYLSQPYTPVDSIRYVFDFVDFKPDLIISGINRGLNISDDIYYSGTVSIAIESILRGIPSIAFSIDKDYKDSDLKYLDELVKFIMDNKLYSKEYALNVNIPINMEKFDYRFTSVKTVLNNTNTDYEAISNKVISITPLQIERTDFKTLKNLNDNFDI